MYFDEALLRFCSLFLEFSQYTSLRLNLSKTKARPQGVGPWPKKLADIAVVRSVKYLGALFGDVTPEVAFDKVVATSEHRCTLISRMPLSMAEEAWQKVQIAHTWCYPILQVTAVAYYAPLGVLVRLRAALRVAFNIVGN